jgi:tetratricopeptide (TPR) repeat protein
MSSTIEGFNYDIFISYRQKDNKYDGWVTEFVDNLKRELEATFKEEISVYFDINPHDGLLETHDVDASLKEKLRCLVFIPILSRTYCDPKSFAWSHEFKAFAELLSGDQFGLKVKLPNGNVANRILPVRIHNLDSDDVKLCESVIGGVLRGIDFIYSSAGVNRPLRSKEDNPHDNLNHTIYRDQINKVSLAVKDIIESMIESTNRGQGKGGTQLKDSAKAEDIIIDELNRDGSTKVRINEMSDKSSHVIGGLFKNLFKRSIILGPVAFLFIVSIIIFSSGSTLPFNKRDWIVITDFENTSGNPVFDKSLYTAFTLVTNQSRYVNVFPKSRMIETLRRMEVKDMSYIDDKTGREMAVREGFNIYIVPGISEVGKRYVITVKILDTKTGDLLKSEILYADNQDKILSTLDRMSKKIRLDLGESRYAVATQDKPLKRVTTSSLEALKLYSLGIDHHLMLDFKGAKEYYQNALKIDTGFTSAKASLGSILIEKFDSLKKGEKLLSQALRSIDNLTEREKLAILAFHAANVEKNFTKGIEYAKMRIALYPDDAIAHNNLGWYYFNLNQFEKAAEEYKAAVRIDLYMLISYSGLAWIYLEKLGIADSALVWSERMVSNNPHNVWGYNNLGSAWLCLDSLSRAEAAFIKAKEINPDMSMILYRLAHTYRLQGHYDEAIGILKNILEKDQNEISAYYDLGVNYQAMGNQVEAIKNFTGFKKYATEVWMKKLPDDPATYIVMSAVTARLGDMVYSNQMLQKAIGIDSTQYEKYAELLCLQGKMPEALYQLEKAFKNGYRNLSWLKLTPDLQLLRYDIRYRNLLEKYFK